ncbi:hypothetical protein BDR06DRAFT_1042018 [Suillus hirtellus]|nr:hypothetical protein BDR06DRAFT_1042018 [Suillus hirtellus]
MSIWRLMSWMMTGSSQKSQAEATCLVKDVIQADDFDIHDLKHFDAHTEMRCFNAAEDSAPKTSLLEGDDWKQADVEIMVPSKEKKCNGNGRPFSVSGLFYWLLIAWLYDKLYMSDAWIQAQDEIQKQRRDDGCQLERVVAGLMFWSDSTCLAQFGSALTWPLYLFFGNMLKYLPSSIKSFIGTSIQRKKYNDVLTHCKRKLFHGVWHILLDDDSFMCTRMGSVLLVTIHDKGNCPCPHCLMPKSQFNCIRYLQDLSQRMKQLHKYFTEKVTQACNAIYTCSTPIKGDLVESILKPFSLMPTINSFVDCLSLLGFDFFLTLVVDLLHKFKLGIVKAVMSHLMWLLYAIDPWKLLTNISSMKQQVARHFEDMLQCAIPAFEGLFPDKHNDVIRILLFHMAEWHALAKMHLHSDETLGAQLQKFSKFTCSAFQTFKLPGETAAHHQKQNHTSESQPSMKAAGPQPKSFNLFTYKLHALGDYMQSIKVFGTTDLYTTQIGELAHHVIKKFYQMTNKKDVSKQLVQHERQQTCLRWQQQLQTEEPAMSSPELHHHLSDSWANSDFILKLKNHLLSRVLGYEYDGNEHQFSDSERNDLCFINNLCWVNYTTYDVQHNQDSMRPGYNCAIMTLSREEGNHIHPFWVGFVPTTDDSAFGFLDLSFVIHGCHLIPAFVQGHSNALLRHSPSECFYVNIFADRDMFAHFTGIGVGHDIQYNSPAIRQHCSEYLEDCE